MYRPGRGARLAVWGVAAPEHPCVADSARDAVRIEAFEQELRSTAADAEQIAEAGERDLSRCAALVDERLPRLLECLRGHGHPVAEPDEPALLLEEERQF